MEQKEVSEKKSKTKIIDSEKVTVDQFLNWVDSLDGNKIITISYFHPEEGFFSSAIEGKKWEHPRDSAWFLLTMRSCGITVRHFLTSTYKKSFNGKTQDLPYKNIFLFYKAHLGNFSGCSMEEAIERGNTCYKTGNRLPTVKGDLYVSSLCLKIKEGDLQ